jgi:hypothetical protein
MDGVARRCAMPWATVRRMSGRSPLRRRRFVALLLAVVATTAGCFSAEMNLTVRDDDTADLTYTVLVDVNRLGELASILGSEAPDLSSYSGEDLIAELFEGEDPCTEMRNALAGREVTSTPVNEGERRGVRCAVERVPVAELSGLGDGTSLSIERQGSATTVEIMLTGIDDLAGDSAELGGELGLSYDELLEIRFVATAPGTLDTHNATSVDGATATWLVTPDAEFVTAGEARLEASWTGGDSSGGGAAITVAIVIAALVVAALAVVIVVRRRNRPAPGTPLPPPSPLQPGGGA